MDLARSFFDKLNEEYSDIHRREGELYWSTHTGQSDEHESLAAASLERKLFVGDPSRLAASRKHLDALAATAPSPARDELIDGLKGWERVFESNTIGNPHAERLLKELAELDAELSARRQSYTMTHIDAAGERVAATAAALRNNLVTNPDESARTSSHEALRGLERWVLENGFLEIVSRRNALARTLGFRDFFEYRLRVNSGLTPQQLFGVFERFEQMTRASHRALLDRLVQEHGPHALQPRNLAYRLRGGVAAGDDAHFPFGKALERWAESFRRMGVSFRGARIEIDLLDRPGKFPTGFCISPIAGYLDGNGERIRADVRFTSTARPRQSGAGLQSLKVLFHEAGHAAHFANIARNSPCFSQEFAPTTPAFLETQAKFFDALPADPCWLKRYAADSTGRPMPDDMILDRIQRQQAALVHMERKDLVPSWFEAGLYRLRDDELTPDRVIALARQVTNDILGIPDHTDYVLAIPHPIYHDTAVYYQGYLLAKMAAAQMRAGFMRTFGHIVDNPAIGQRLAEHCWKDGNGITLDDALLNLTGEPLTPRYLADECNRSPVEARVLAAAAIDRSEQPSGLSVADDLDASISIVHGRERIATNDDTLQAMYDAFETWIAGQSREIME